MSKKFTFERDKIGLEDITTGFEIEKQERNGITVNVTQINANNIPYSKDISLAEVINSSKADTAQVRGCVTLVHGLVTAETTQRLELTKQLEVVKLNISALQAQDVAFKQEIDHRFSRFGSRIQQAEDTVASAEMQRIQNDLDTNKLDIVNLKGQDVKLFNNISELNNYINDLKAKYNQLSLTDNTLDDKITDTNLKISSIESNHSALESNISTFKAEFTDLVNSTGVTVAQVTRNKSDIADLNKKIDILNISKVSADIDAQNTRINNALNQVDTRVNEVTAKQNEINRAVTDVYNNVNASLQSVKDTVNITVDAKVTDLSNTVDTKIADSHNWVNSSLASQNQQVTGQIASQNQQVTTKLNSYNDTINSRFSRFGSRIQEVEDKVTNANLDNITVDITNLKANTSQQQSCITYLNNRYHFVCATAETASSVAHDNKNIIQMLEGKVEALENKTVTINTTNDIYASTNNSEIPSVEAIKKLVNEQIDDGLPVGHITMFKNGSNPSNYIKCDGRQFSKTLYPKLAALYPDGYVPDLRDNLDGALIPFVNYKDRVDNDKFTYKGLLRTWMDDADLYDKETTRVEGNISNGNSRYVEHDTWSEFFLKPYGTGRYNNKNWYKIPRLFNKFVRNLHYNNIRLDVQEDDGVSLRGVGVKARIGSITTSNLAGAYHFMDAYSIATVSEHDSVGTYQQYDMNVDGSADNRLLALTSSAAETRPTNFRFPHYVYKSQRTIYDTDYYIKAARKFLLSPGRRTASISLENVMMAVNDKAEINHTQPIASITGLAALIAPLQDPDLWNRKVLGSVITSYQGLVNGHLKFANGLIFIWGVCNVSRKEEGLHLYNYHIAFPTKCIGQLISTINLKGSAYCDMQHQVVPYSGTGESDEQYNLYNEERLQKMYHRDKIRVYYQQYSGSKAANTFSYFCWGY